LLLAKVISKPPADQDSHEWTQKNTGLFPFHGDLFGQSKYLHPCAVFTKSNIGRSFSQNSPIVAEFGLNKRLLK
jgi:hypothetical protein